MSENKVKPPETPVVGLRRELGLVSAVNFLINIIVGSGIFMTPGKVLEETGSVGMMLTIWVVCGVIAFLACLPFGELSAVVPKSGSMYIYIHTAFSSYHPFFGGLPAFIFFWMTYAVVEPSTTAVNGLLFADYFFIVLKLFVSESILSNEALIKCILGASSLVFVAGINCFSLKAYMAAQNCLTYMKMLAIIFTIGCGFYMHVTGSANDFQAGFEGTNFSVRGLTQAMYFGLFAYDGGYAITGITEELKNPEKHILTSILIALSITTATYLLLNITFLAALSQTEMANGTTVIADFAEKLFGSSGGAIAALIISICLLTSILCGTFFNSRMGYVAAREGHIIKTLSCIHSTWHTPVPSVVFQILLSLFYFFVGGDITFLIDMYSFFMWMAYGFTMVALFVLRVKKPHAYRPFRVPTIIPLLIIVIACFLVTEALLYASLNLLITFVVCVVVVIIVYYIFIYRDYNIKTFDKMQVKLQSLLMLIPANETTTVK